MSTTPETITQHEATQSMPLMGEGTVARFIGVSVHTLRHWRVAKTGPKFLKVGRSVKYRQSDLDSYLDNVTAQTTEA